MRNGKDGGAAVSRHATPLADRFWSKVKKDSGLYWDGSECWLWIAYRGGGGYGRINDRGRCIYAHRVAYELAHGPIPATLQVLHHCDTPACVRPEHLFVGDWLLNAQDRARKGRWPATLTAASVQEIRRLWAAGKHSQSSLAAQFGVQIPAISRLVTGKTWRHLP
jgi:hypothetical protein